MNCDICAICKEGIEDDSRSYVTLTEKSALSVCNAIKERNDDFIVTVGDKVYRSCRDPYINKKNIRSCNKRSHLLLLMALLVDAV